MGNLFLQLLTDGLQRYLLKGLVILWTLLLLMKNVISVTPFTFSTHMHLYFFSFQRVLTVVGVVTGSFYFVIVIVCLLLYRQACRYLLYLCEFFFSFMDLFSELIYLKLSVFFFKLVLVFVTRVLALCGDGSKQMSDLPFLFSFFLLKNKL